MILSSPVRRLRLADKGQASFGPSQTQKDLCLSFSFFPFSFFLFSSFSFFPFFRHSDGICLYILEFAGGVRVSACDDVWTGPARAGAESDIGIHWRVEGTDGMARGTIGWPDYPNRTPSTLDFTTKRQPGYWFQPRWSEVWFPDAFVGPMAQLLCALEEGVEPEISGKDNLKTMALVDACYLSVKEQRAVKISEITRGRPG